jgi:hypothetical protein
MAKMIATYTLGFLFAANILQSAICESNEESLSNLIASTGIREQEDPLTAEQQESILRLSKILEDKPQYVEAWNEVYSTYQPETIDKVDLKWIFAKLLVNSLKAESEHKRLRDLTERGHDGKKSDALLKPSD